MRTKEKKIRRSFFMLSYLTNGEEKKSHGDQEEGGK